jgi:hypothetical protein
VDASSIHPTGWGALNETFRKLTESTVKAPNARMASNTIKGFFSNKERITRMEFYHRGGRLEPLYRRRWQIIVAMIYFHA